MAENVIPTKVAAAILGMDPQDLRDEMAAGRLDIGWVKPKNKKKMSGRGTDHVYRAKLAAHLGVEPDHVWEQERIHA